MPFRIEPLDIVIVLLVALLIFGPSRLPDIGRGLGKAISEFRRGSKEMIEGFSEGISGQEQPAPPPQPEPANGNFCTQCGAANPLDARFCSQCGAQLPA
jgi:sec-independent protein translocase protein TatA